MYVMLKYYHQGVIVRFTCSEVIATVAWEEEHSWLDPFGAWNHADSLCWFAHHLTIHHEAAYATAE